MTTRFPIHGLDPAGATATLNTPRYDPVTDTVTWADGSTSGTLDSLADVDTTTVAPTDGQALLYDAASGLWVPGTISGGGGGGSGFGATVLLDDGQTVAAWQTANSATVPVGAVVFRKAPAGSTWNFAGLSALPAGWTRRGVASETFAVDGMQATLAAGQGYQVAIPGGVTNDFTVELGIVSGTNAAVMQGPIIADSTGGGGASVWYNSPVGDLAATVTGWSYGSSFTNGGGTPTWPSRLRVRKSGTTYNASFSTNNGATWSAEVNVTKAGTPASIGFGSILGSAAMKVSYVKFSPGGGGQTGLLGWWDGTSIVPF